jgi:hypothetical protein
LGATEKTMMKRKTTVTIALFIPAPNQQALCFKFSTLADNCTPCKNWLQGRPLRYQLFWT